MVILACICQNILKTKQYGILLINFSFMYFFSLLTQTTLALKLQLPTLEKEKEFLLEISHPQTVPS